MLFCNALKSFFSKKPEMVITESLQEALSSENDAIILCTFDGIISYFNKISLSIFPHIALHHSIFTIIRTPLLKEAFDELMETNKSKMMIDFSIRVPTEINFHIFIIKTKDNFWIRLQDVTEQKRSLKMHGDFVANVSHELRTPLASICGFIETLQTSAKNDPEATEQFLGIMEAQAKRMNHLIQSLLSLSRVEIEQHIAPVEKCDLTPLIKDVVRATEPLGYAKNIHITHQLDDKPRLILGYTEQIFQIFQNLIENAVKYSPNDTYITLTATETDILWKIHVIDQGCGIAPDHIPRLTERFYRVDDARHRSKGGAGLGLSIVEKIIIRHKGTLEITSELSKGSDFTVCLPKIKTENISHDIQ